VQKFCKENNKPILKTSGKAEAALLAYHWPGNVRELENIIERAVVLSSSDTIEDDNLPVYLGARQPNGSEGPIVPGASLNDIERHALLKTLESVHFSTQRAAEILGISVRKIQYKLKEYGLARKRGSRRALLPESEDGGNKE
jgi:DNA-binding NtrC family response regulator